MIVFPNCKINLGLHVVDKRKDGYHNLESFFYPIPLYDALEIVKGKEKENNLNVNFTLSGYGVSEIGTGSNSCINAYNLLKADFLDLPSINMHLQKGIPVGAGLGGGSADAVFTLKALREMFELDIPHQQLINYSKKLGSDCPFFLINKPCFVSGTGDILEQVNTSLADFKIVIINPGIHIDTASAFRDIIPKPPQKKIREIINLPVKDWKLNLTNDFEESIFKKFPEINNIKQSLYQTGAVYASMSGSGSSVYGLFLKEQILNLSFPPHCFVKELLLT